MEKLIFEKSVYNDDTRNIINDIITLDNIYNENTIILDNEQSDLKLRDEMFCEEQALTKKSFETFGFISSEKWDNVINLSAKILDISPTHVSCECVIDKENKEFEIRNFPRNLFLHIHKLKREDFVLIRIKDKPGSIRIDVFDGNAIVDKTIFEIKDLWDELENSGLDKPIEL